MKFNKNYKKLRTSVFLYFFIFTVLLVFLIWIVQTVFFEANYQKTRVQTMDSYSEVIYNSLTTNNQINETAVITLKEAGVNTVLVKKTHEAIELVYPKPTNNPQITDLYTIELFSAVINALDIENKETVSGMKTLSSNEPYLYSGRRIIYQNQNCYLILVCHMNSVSDAVEVLKIQLITTAVIILIISGFLSWIISGKISAPVTKMSNVAKRWAGGEDSLEFERCGYSEIDGLADSLNYAKSEISKSNKLQRDLLANVSHDLKTPLTMIKAYAEMIRDISGGVKAKRDKHTNVIIEEADRLTLLVNDILSLSRLQSSVDVLEKTTFNLSELTENVLYRFETVVKEQGYTIIKDIEPDLFINGDEKKIEEVIYNLIGNSINYTGEDKTVQVYLKKSGYSAVMEVLDSGKGMDSEQINTIWEKYYRVSETHHRAVKGTGLGLSIVKTILESHGLKFGVLSKPSVGSNFYVEFTLVDENEGGTSNE